MFPDGAGWIYVSNSESEPGGVGAMRFDGEGRLVDAYGILDGTERNCSGGPTPWGTWLSCEEFDALEAGGSAGQVWECDPTGERRGRVLPALGRFSHEAVAVDPVERHLYLSEDQPDGRFYRFTPSRWPALDDGLLEAAYVSVAGRVTWIEVPDPEARRAPLRRQLPATTAFDGGEGLWYDSGGVYLTTKGDGYVRRYDVERSAMEAVYDPRQIRNGPLRGVDNITASRAGDLYVATDGTDSRIVVISREGEATPFLQLADEPEAELTGPAFSPDGRRFYFSSMRGGPDGGGVTYEVEGPFRTTGGRGRSATPLLSSAPSDGFGTPEVTALGVTAATTFGVAAGLLWRQRRRSAGGDDIPIGDVGDVHGS